MEKLKMQSFDLTQKNIEAIEKLFPNVITEVRDGDGKLKKAVDFDLLNQELSSVIVEGDKERYQLTWPGKKAAMLLANTPINKTLRPIKEESVDWDNTQNLYIEGDNLEVLKLLQESYLGKVKCIYIDPPYNTGKDFIYRDDFKQLADEYLEESGQVDENGNRLFQNTESNGRFHSDWLTMMYPRLKLARSLLRDDGVIFISIDDNEVANLRKICDEIFGSKNFVVNIVWQKKYGPANDAKLISTTHEHILVYTKNSESWIPGLIPRNKSQLAAFSNPDNDPRGIWRASDLSARTYNKNCVYPIIGPTGKTFYPPESRSWIVTEEKFKELLKDNRITFGRDGNGRPMQKKFLSEVKKGITPESWWSRDKVGDNKSARYEIKDLIPENVFDTPKPSTLITYIIKIANIGTEGIILDFFSGSATTAHAVMQLNAEDGGNRKYIMVQLPEPTSEDSEAYKAGYRNICEIGKERIRRAAKKIKEETNADIDYGFRVFRVDSSNMKDVYNRPSELDQGKLEQLESNIKEDRTAEDLLIQAMLECGLELSLPMETREIEGKKVLFVAGNSLVACFDEEVSEQVIKEIAKEQPLRVIFRDHSFKDDADRINVEEIFKMLSPATEIKVI